MAIVVTSPLNLFWRSFAVLGIRVAEVKVRGNWCKVPGGQLDVVPRAVCGIWVHGGQYLGAGEEGEQE